ncbi:MAG: hypothetical protein KJN76_06520 [Eudoraea sp.]|nr:hypothetical protein [Eudoraea sp.]
MCIPSPPPPQKPPVITITITATTAVPHPPGISDGTTTLPPGGPNDKAFTTEVVPGQTVKFTMAGDITGITKIKEGSGSDIFSQDPTPENDFTGIIGSLPSSDTRAYTIYYNVKDAPKNPYHQDPQLKMR